MKEVTAYQKDAEAQQRKVDSMVASNADEYDTRQQASGSSALLCGVRDLKLRIVIAAKSAGGRSQDGTGCTETVRAGDIGAEERFGVSNSFRALAASLKPSAK